MNKLAFSIFFVFLFFNIGYSQIEFSTIPTFNKDLELKSGLCQDYVIQIYSDENLTTKSNKTTFSCTDPAIYLAPLNLFPSSFDKGLPYNALNILITATSGTTTNLNLLCYNSNDQLVDKLTVMTSIYNYFLPQSGVKYAIDKTNTDSGTYTYQIIDVISGATLCTGTFTVNAGAESTKTVLIIPVGTGGYSGPGVTQGWDISGPNNYDGVLGLGKFNPANAGVGTHMITYTWNNNQPGPNNCRITKAIPVTVTGGVNCNLDIQDNTWDGFSIYPNPTSNFLFITNSNTIDTIEVFNSIGQNVLKQNNLDFSCILDVTSLANGIYTIKVSSNNKQKISRFVKQ